MSASYQEHHFHAVHRTWKYERAYLHCDQEYWYLLERCPEHEVSRVVAHDLTDLLIRHQPARMLRFGPLTFWVSHAAGSVVKATELSSTQLCTQGDRALRFSFIWLCYRVYKKNLM